MTYSLTLEHDTKPTITVRGDYPGNDVEKAFRRAMRQADKAKGRLKPTSICFVINIPQLAGVSEAHSR